MRIKLIRAEGGWGYYALPSSPDNPYRPIEVVVRAGDRLYRLETWAYYEDGAWAIALPLNAEEVELIYLR
ncbi:MAG: hypothetical protein TU35_007395 [Thermoproteus sp. AZ2]|jgi:hypothetical protein|uniref:Uncharacterized protein n=1 Tax=Thermoproteus sp. AZ2 TaxID=1609232 RepID=A0ACC6V1W4_9CREN|nr:MAG: hypothetical protein TU35_07705 [Thermoproteus sp. AZ2]